MPKPWTFDETKALIQHAGDMPVSEIAAMLNRGQHDVRRRASVAGVRLHHRRAATVTCPSCLRERTRLARGSEVCRVCATRERAEANRREFDRIYASAPASVRSTVGRWFGVKGNYAKPRGKPPTPRLSGMSDAMRARAIEGYVASVERWELAAATRCYANSRRRLSRLRAAIKDSRV